MALEEQVVKKLIEKNFHISFAESCTGGMFSPLYSCRRYGTYSFNRC